jgi:hypothetical protein
MQHTLKDPLRTLQFVKKHGHENENRFVVALIPEQGKVPFPMSRVPSLPESLRARGILDAEWKEFMENLAAAAATADSTCCSMLCWIFACPIACCCVPFSKTLTKSRVQSVIDKFNADVGKRANVFARLRRHLADRPASRASHTVQASWLAIAISEEEKTKLEQEPFITVNPNTCTCCACCVPYCAAISFGGV